jgi:UDP-glucose 4-epimerase|tara:strand:- start:1444 stop:2379 length:936 start_codon:yes stop_codon:yes gene_type:complete
MKSEKILVTGGAGFIGSHLVENLINQGHELMVVDNLLSGKKQNIEHIISDNLFFDEIGSEEILKKVKHFNPDICFHLAAQSSVVISVEDPMLDFEHNILQPLQLIRTLLSTDCKKFVFSSSGGTIFGEPDIIPTSEIDFAGEPESPYGISKKRLNEFIELLFSNKENTTYSILNFSNVYGPRQDPHGEAGVVSIFTSKMMNNLEPTVFGDGEQTRDYIFVQDVVDALLLSSTIDEDLFLNIGTGNETSVNDLVSTLKSTIGYLGEVKYEPKRDGELLRSVLDNSKAKKILSWEPQYSLESGITELVNWLSA